MGSQDSKPQIQKNKQVKDKVQSPDNKKTQRSIQKQNGKSLSNGQRSPRISNDQGRIHKNKGSQNSISNNMINRNSSLSDYKLNTKNSISNSIVSNKNIQNINDDKQDDNQFMPLLKLREKGSLKIKITLYQIIVPEHQNHLNQNSAVYNASLQYNKDSSNSYKFNLKQDGGYGINFRADLQGNLIVDKNIGQNAQNLWIVLCPINIPFGPIHRISQYNCINIYEQFYGHDNQDNQGPSLKNIDIQIDDETYYKWGQKPAKNNNKPPINNSDILMQYREISRYLDYKQNWVGSTFIQQTKQFFRAWIVNNTSLKQKDDKLSKQLNRDIEKRQKQYIEYMYRKLKR